MCACSSSGSYHVVYRGCFALPPQVAGTDLDQHQPDVPRAGLLRQGVEVAEIRGLLREPVVVRREHRVEREAPQGLEVRGRGAHAVSGDADRADEALLLRAHRASPRRRADRWRDPDPRGRRWRGAGAGRRIPPGDARASAGCSRTHRKRSGLRSWSRGRCGLGCGPSTCRGAARSPRRREPCRSG